MSGKWDLPDVPHDGWTCVSVTDLRKSRAICEMCEAVEIRYVHHMEHPKYPEVVDSGCICAQHMEGDEAAPKEREKIMKNISSRRDTWLLKTWKVSSNGNDTMKTIDGFFITVFFQRDTWVFVVNDRVTGDKCFSQARYATSDEAKLAALDHIASAKIARLRRSPARIG